MADNKKWYVLRVVSGKERKLKGYIDSEIARSKWTEIVPQVLVPTERVYQIKAGKKVIKEKNLFPGYIFVQAQEGMINGDIIAGFRSFSGVIGFLGKNNPIPMRDDEANRMLGKVDEMQDAGENMAEPFIVNETIKIIDGPFNDFQGTIEEIYDEKKKLKVIVKIFGRRTPVELNFMQVEKLT